MITAELTWETLGLSDVTLESIRKAGYGKPTPIQAASIPISLQGRDLIASAQTGTGKTASFVLPLVERVAGREGTLALILSPTREIAQQTAAVLELFGAPRGVRSVVLIGGTNMKMDEKALREYPQVIVATPGRLCDHLERGNLWLDFVQVLVLDEADRMLDMGFSDQLARITRDLPSTRQTMVFSATISPSVKKLAQKILNNPEQVSIGQPMAAAKNVDQKLIWMYEESKNGQLDRLLKEETGTVIVFTRSKDGASRVSRSLHSRGNYDSTMIHSDRRQSDRELALADFKEGKYRVLIATDVAGRGIHVDDVAHVVNYDLPRSPEDYIHRIGRTGRIGAIGKATSFATPRDKEVVRAIERLIGHPIPEVFTDRLEPQGTAAGQEQSQRHGQEQGRGESSRRSSHKPSKNSARTSHAKPTSRPVSAQHNVAGAPAGVNTQATPTEPVVRKPLRVISPNSSPNASPNSSSGPSTGPIRPQPDAARGPKPRVVEAPIQAWDSELSQSQAAVRDEHHVSGDREQAPKARRSPRRGRTGKASSGSKGPSGTGA